MLWRRQTKKPDLSFFRSSEDWETFECLYFRDLDFIDIEDSIDSYNRKMMSIQFVLNVAK